MIFCERASSCPYAQNRKRKREEIRDMREEGRGKIFFDNMFLKDLI